MLALRRVGIKGQSRRPGGAAWWLGAAAPAVRIVRFHTLPELSFLAARYSDIGIRFRSNEGKRR